MRHFVMVFLPAQDKTRQRFEKHLKENIMSQKSFIGASSTRRRGGNGHLGRELSSHPRK
jgi:hypothetical protein